MKRGRGRPKGAKNKKPRSVVQRYNEAALRVIFSGRLPSSLKLIPKEYGRPEHISNSAPGVWRKRLKDAERALDAALSNEAASEATTAELASVAKKIRSPLEALWEGARASAKEYLATHPDEESARTRALRHFLATDESL
jgi:hypothetical protein